LEAVVEKVVVKAMVEEVVNWWWKRWGRQRRGWQW
jgi:hypothetical protein